jgi:hypothetical protein
MGIYSTPQKRFGWQQWNCNVVGCPPSSGGSACVDTTAADLYQLTINSKLDPCATYRITDYRSVNWLNGYWTADYDAPPNVTGPYVLMNPFTFNANDLSAAYLIGNIIDIKKSTYDGSYIIAGTVNTYYGHDSWGILKVGVDGFPITSFQTPYSTGLATSAIIYAFNELSNGSIIASLNITLPIITPYLQNPIVKFNSDGSADSTYAVNGIGLGSPANVIVNQSTGKTIIAGGFVNYSDNNSVIYNRNRIIRLNADGSEDVAFYNALGTAFNATVRSAIVLPDDSLIVVGDFTSFNGVAANRIVKLNADGTRNTTFDTNVGSGFNDDVLGIKYHPFANAYVVYGRFTTLDGNSHDKIVRILADGNVDSTWLGGLVINGDVYSATIDTSIDTIYIGGDFVDIDGDTNAHIVARLTFDGTGFITLNGAGFQFGTASILVYDPVTTGVVVYGPTDFDGKPLGFGLSKITSAPTPTPNYDPREIYTSPDNEVIIIKARDVQSFEPVAYSETYGDILEFMPYCKTIGLPYQNGLYNGVTLPDSTTLTGFDLQWDGTQAYIDMPANYPALFGHLMYIYFQFNSSSDYFEFFREPLVPGFNDNWQNSFPYGGKALLYPIIVQGDGVRIIIPGITYEMFLDYTTDSLYMDTVEAFGPAYGWVTRRIDTERQIDAPLDWRNFRYRRWQVDVFNDNKKFAYIGCSGDAYNSPTYGNVITTGNYNDFSMFPAGSASFSVTIGGRGGTLNYWWWNGTVDNVTFSSGDMTPVLQEVKIDTAFLSESALSRRMGNVNITLSSINRVYHVVDSGNATISECIMNNVYMYNVILIDSFSKVFANDIYATAVIFPTMFQFSIDSLSASNSDFRGGVVLGGPGLKRIFQASNYTYYLESFNGTSYSYTAYPF